MNDEIEELAIILSCQRKENFEKQSDFNKSNLRAQARTALNAGYSKNKPEKLEPLNIKEIELMKSALCKIKTYPYRVDSRLEKEENLALGFLIDKAEDICRFGTSTARVITEEEILKVIINHMKWDQTGYELTEDGWLTICTKWQDGSPQNITRIKINQIDLAKSIRDFITGER